VNQHVRLAEFGVEGHPSEDQLLLTLEGEVAAEEAARVQQHLAGCWSCKARYEEMQRGILAFVEYREKRYLPALESPSSDSSGFRARLRIAAREAPAVPFLARLRRKLPSLWRPFQHVQLRWVTVVAAAMVALLIWTEVLSPPPVSASELLTRAMAAQKSPASGHSHLIRQTLQIRSGERVVTRNFEWNTDAPIRPARWDVDADPLAWNAPLTAQGFSDWRDGLSTKTDKVKRAGDRLLLDTLAPEDAIREAWISVRAADFHPMAEHIRFHDGRELDLTEVAFQFRQETEPPVAVAQSAAPKVAAPPAAPKPDLDQAEIDLRYILFAHRWDLGEDLTVERNTSGVTLSGIVSSPERKQAIQEALKGAANVRLNLTLPTASNAPAANDTTIRQDAQAKSVPLLQDTLDRSFSSPDERMAFDDRCLFASDTALAHAWALKRLADRYRDPDNTGLKPGSQTKLQEMLRGHLQELGRANDDLDPLMKLLRAPAAATPAASSNWPNQILALFTAVEQQDRDVTSLVSGSQTPEQNLAQVSAEFRSSHQAIHLLLGSLK
jgi:anti-sigma factor RsiW